MLTFKKLELGDYGLLNPILRTLPYRVGDQSFPSLYIWEKAHPTQFAMEDGVLYILYLKEEGRVAYQMPIGAGDNLEGAVHKLEEDAKRRGIALELVTINDDMKAEIEAGMPGYFDFFEERDYSEYMYEAESLRTLKGKKLHAKRNYLNRFRTTYEGRYAFEAVHAENAGEIIAFNQQWDVEHGFSEDIRLEADAVRLAVTHLDEIGMVGVALRLDGEIIAYALGTVISGDTLLEQIEKAADIPGAYQMINNEFALRFSEGLEYINREEDLGIEGLRKAKLSYFPAYLNTRWRAVRHV